MKTEKISGVGTVMFKINTRVTEYIFSYLIETFAQSMIGEKLQHLLSQEKR